MSIQKKLNPHFIGIGGIGVSALAKYYKSKGHKISGSDIALKGHAARNIPKETDLVVYSPAVKPDNPEIKEAKRRKIKLQSYPQALGELTKQYFTIAVAGTHGKSTTTAMIGLILTKAGLDPTVIVGTKVKEFGNSNCRTGKSAYLVIEACEHEASFLNYSPNIIVITNIEAEHLDYFKSFGNVLRAFKKFTAKLPENGVLIDSKKYKKTKDAAKLRKILKIPGEHNVENGLAALAAARALKIPDKISFQALAEFQGTWRRFEERNLKIGSCQLKIVSDYGHHPTEIRATLQAAKEKWPKKKIWCVFQPHQYQRTHYLFNDFIEALEKAPVDKLIITDIFDVAGRESKKLKEKVSSEKLVKAINNAKTIYLSKDKIIGCLKKDLRDGEVVIFMGAGDIYQIDKKFH